MATNAPRIPSQEELEQRRRLQVGPETVSNQASTDFPGHWPGENHAWNIDHFRETFRVQFHKSEPLDSEFSLIGIDTSIANAFRRILISEIPTLAIEDVFIRQNTSIMQDEVLAHRLGLIPLAGNRNALNWMKWYHRPTEDNQNSGSPSDYNCAVLHLNIKCEWKADGLKLAAQGETDPDKLFVNHSVYAKDLRWTPIGKQEEIFGDGRPLEAVNPDILIVKLRPGQSIDLLMHAFKGIGQDHAKFSPVATASYRLLPTIDILKPIVGDDAKKFAKCFPKGVIDTPVITTEDSQDDLELQGKEGQVRAVVKNAMKDTVSREVLRHEEFKDKVKLGRIRDHFIFKIESTGQWDSEDLFLESVKLLKVKCQRIRRGLDEMNK
ncbi:DNA-directed RNA polymeras-like proteines I and III subunit RPAC1 [Aaosphaeria arxii CBS 175.79]|uniref:DNA-directed RNA polymerases I and III subunit RPAC1 n=1 Tax=Aaosphaeria arxii CBS 175.79 TaxID=1450172 RepID=A0A6A5XJM8_9PLEO|nr:DNA-directed RNA polymeras-like proteines I and III subunit RPAC1 [Aaosphaeria arxii CBS 175.79]KAF2013322.1 DNA-directed RNA polymeras-like proteines I and III subunit RPAC1 [Aaosphaeria arxii CBS 175.79]